MPAEDAKTHWETVYTTKAPNQVSWYRPHLERSLSLIERAAGGVSASIIDVGGGEPSLDENANVLTIPFRSPRRVQIQLDRLEPIRISFARSFEARLGHSQA